jgi:hypothetical protein
MALPFAPIDEWCHRHLRYTTPQGVQLPCSERLIAQAVGLDHRAVQRLRRDGLDVFQADRLAIRLGLLPHELWDDY